MKLSGFFTTGKGGRISLILLDRDGIVSFVHVSDHLNSDGGGTERYHKG